MTTEPTTRVLPELVRLSDLARELHTRSCDLVKATRRGEFPPLVRVGRLWFARRADVDAWFARNHAGIACLCGGTPGAKCPLHKPEGSHG